MSFKSIRAAVLTSTAVRHLYFHWVISENFDVRAALVQGKGNYYDSQREESELVRSHFSNLAAAESAEFKARLNPSLPRREVPDINEPELVVETLAAGTEIVFLLGTAILPEAWLNAFPNRILNLHLGLSPFDRGVGDTVLAVCPERTGMCRRQCPSGSRRRRCRINPRAGQTGFTGG
jgi:hypothetical protein